MKQGVSYVKECAFQCQLILLPLLGFAVAALFPLTPNSVVHKGRIKKAEGRRALPLVKRLSKPMDYLCPGVVGGSDT
jgi:hypothetical protein